MVFSARLRQKLLRGTGYAASGVAVLGLGQVAKLRWQYECPGGSPRAVRGFAVVTVVINGNQVIKHDNGQGAMWPNQREGRTLKLRGLSIVSERKNAQLRRIDAKSSRSGETRSGKNSINHNHTFKNPRRGKQKQRETMNETTNSQTRLTGIQRQSHLFMSCGTWAVHGSPCHKGKAMQGRLQKKSISSLNV